MIPTALTLLTALPQVDDGEDFPAALAVFLAVSSIGFFAAVSVIVWQLAATWRSKMSVAREQAYQELANRSALAIDHTSNRLDEHSTALTQIQGRLAEIERLLKEVG